MNSDRPPTPFTPELARLSLGERLAVWAFRRSVHGPVACVGLTVSFWPRSARDIGLTLRSLRIAHEQLVQRQGVGLRVAVPGTLALTYDERQLMEATAAAQADRLDVLDGYLFRLAPSRTVRPHLAKAVTELGATLAMIGCWLPVPPQKRSLPAAALPVARLRSASLADVEVAWPSTRPMKWQQGAAFA